MPTPTTSLRIPPDLRAEGETRARAEHLSFTDLVVRALAAELGRPAPAAGRAMRERAESAEARLAATMTELAALKAKAAAAAGITVSGQPPVTMRGDRDAGLAAALRRATPELPATRQDLVRASGFDPKTVERKLGVLMERGDVARPALNKYYGVPGADIEAGLEEAARRVRLAQRERRTRSAAPRRETPAGPARRQGRPGAPPAAEAAVIQRLRGQASAIAHGGVPASPVFMAGPDVDCLHEGLTRRPGTCPECRQQVGRR